MLQNSQQKSEKISIKIQVAVQMMAVSLDMTENDKGKKTARIKCLNHDFCMKYSSKSIKCYALMRMLALMIRIFMSFVVRSIRYNAQKSCNRICQC